MARIRSIKPEFFVNEQLATLPYEWRLLFAGLWTQADRAGRLEDRPLRLKAALFPYDDLDIDQGLGRLANAGLITRYEGNGQRIIAIPKWQKHQQPHIKEAPSLFPAPVNNDASQVLALVEPVDPDPDPDPDQEGKVIARRALEQAFDRFWAEYPNKVAKDAARRVWQRLAPDNDLRDRIMAALRVHKASPQWTKDGGQFIPHPRTWLHQRRWEDQPVKPIAETRSVDAASADEKTKRYIEEINARPVMPWPLKKAGA